MRVLHIGTERAWRGGENQVRLLIAGLEPEGDIASAVAYPAGSRAWAGLSRLAPGVPLASARPFDPRSLTRLLRFCRDQRITILDAHSSGAMSLALLLKRFRPRLKLVVHRRAGMPLRRRAWTRWKYLSPAVDRFVAISDFIAGLLGDYGVPAAKIRTVRSAVDPEPYATLRREDCRRRWLERAGIPGDRFVVGFAAALDLDKGPDLAVAAFADFARDHARAHLLMAGSGRLEAAVRSQVAGHGLPGQVTMLGFTSELSELLQSFDVLLMPSRWEGLGTVGLEALAAGTPVLASRVGGIPEFIHDGETGILHAPGDVAAIASGLRRLAGSPELRSRLAAAGRATVLRDFAPGSMVAGNRSVYHELGS